VSEHRYELVVDGPVYQTDEAGRLRRIDGRDVDQSRPFYWFGEENVHEQGEEPLELGPGWRELGYLTQR
jgi:hypothetical protein